MGRKDVPTYTPRSNSTKEYMKNNDNLIFFEYILYAGSKMVIADNSFYLKELEKENVEGEDVLDFVKETQTKSKFLMHFLRKQFFIFHVHLFEYLLLNMIREIHQTDKRTLKSCNKPMPISEMVEAIEEDRLMDTIVDTTMDGLGKGSYEQISKYFSNQFKINLSDSGVKDKDIVEAFQLRHVIVHNNGTIDREFKKKIKKKKYIEGKKAHISQKNFDRTRILFMRIARYLDSKYHDKFGPPKA